MSLLNLGLITLWLCFTGTLVAAISGILKQPWREIAWRMGAIITMFIMAYVLTYLSVIVQ